MPEPTLLFVYGSLRRGQQHHAELAAAAFVGEARTLSRYRVVQAGDYPGLIAGAEVVVGELYGVNAAQLVALDIFEGSGYERRPIELAGGVRAEAYFLRGS